MGGWRYPRGGAKPFYATASSSFTPTALPFNGSVTPVYGPYSAAGMSSMTAGPNGIEYSLISHIDPPSTYWFCSTLSLNGGFSVAAGTDKVSISTTGYNDIILYPKSSGRQTFSGCDVVGVDPVNARGTTVIAGGDYTKGDWYRLSSSTAKRYRGIAINASCYNGPYTGYVDVGITSTPEDMIIISDWETDYDNGTYDIFPAVSMIFPTDIAPGSQLHVRACSSGAATLSVSSRTLYILLLLFW